MGIPTNRGDHPVGSRHTSCLVPRMPFVPPPRLRSFDYRGPYRYFLTICCASRALVFITHERVDLVLWQLARTCASHHFAVPAYCVMPDHLHALLEGVDDASDFRECVRQFKQRSAF